MALYLGQLGELVPENHSQLPYLYKYYTISLTNHQFTMVHSILLVTGSIARSANLPVFRLLRGRF